MKALIPLLAVFALVGLGPQAKAASIQYSLNQDGCTGTCGTGPFGTVTLTDMSATQVKVTVTLAPNVAFVGTGAGDALGFNVSGSAITSITGLTSGFSYPGQLSYSTFGDFGYSIKCDVCGPGASVTNSGPLTFFVNRASGINVNSFVGNGTPNTSGYYFAADIIGNNGKTGNVGSKGDTRITINEVPEPMTLSLLGVGLFGMGLLKRARRK
jgi:hypothetical protein